MNTSEFAGKTALVTGASRGIGAATAIALAKHGMKCVVLHYNGYKQGAEETRAAVRQAGADCEIMQADLATVAGIHEFVRDLKTTAPAVDVLINNAGHLVRRARLLEMTDELFDAVMNLNVKSMW